MREDALPGKWWLTAAAWLALAVFATTTTLISVSLKHLGADLQVDFSARGALAVSRALVLTVSALLSGYVADRVGKRWLMTGAMFVVAAGLLLVGRVSTFGQLLVAVMFIGVGLGCLEALVSPLIAQLHPRDVATQMNVLHAFYPVGIVASSLAIGAALDHGVRWQVPFVVAAAPAAAVGLMFALGRYGHTEGQAGVAPMRVRRILRDPAFWPLLLAMAFGAGAEGGITYWAPNFIQNEYATPAVQGALGLTVFSVAMAAGRFGLGALVRRVSTWPLFIAMIVLGLASVTALVLIDSIVVSLVLMGLAGVSVAIVWPGILSLAADHISAGSATLFAMLSAGGIIGFGTVPQVMGGSADRVGLRAGFLAVPLSLLAMGIALAVFYRVSRPGSDSTEG